MRDARLADWLGSLDDEAVTAVLERRPDVVAGLPPTTLGQLAERLGHPSSLGAALRGLTAPGLQALAALQALGERRTRSALADLLTGGPGPEHGRAVAAAIAELTAAALVWPAEGDRLQVPDDLEQVLASPVGSAPPAGRVWPDQNVGVIDGALRALGDRPRGTKAEKLAALLALIANPERVRAVAEQAPPEVADGLRRMAWAGDDGEGDDLQFDRFDYAFYRRQDETRRWGIAHGLLVQHRWEYREVMPAEVALALRGPAYRAPFTPRPPEIELHDRATEQIESAAAAAITSFTTRALALLDRTARTPIPQLAGGGIGVRELGKLAKQLGSDDVEVRLVLALADAAGLLDPRGEGLEVSGAFAGWRRAEPAEQAATLIAAWWAYPSAPTQLRDASGKTLPVLRGVDPCAGCRAARIVLLEVAGALPAGAAAEPGALARLARWRRPLLHVLPQDADAPLATVWREAELLGVVARGAVSPLGRALLEGDGDALVDRLGGLLPAASDSATFGSDLTALVAGTPSARVTGLLDSCADRESSGGAITWRFSPASVRRALDSGIGADALLEELGDIAGRELPQPLTYLVRDVGRRHGRLRLLPAVSLIRSDDEARLAEVLADSTLAGLGLQRVSPTVVSCAVPLESALARLREVGYFPVAEPGACAPAPPATHRPRPGPAGPKKPVPFDPRDVATRLLAGGDLGPPAGSPTTALLARAAPSLSSDEVDQLARAVDDGGRLQIAYCAASGAVTNRVIQDPDLEAGMLYAWCELRQDERVFAVARILSVAPVG